MIDLCLDPRSQYNWSEHWREGAHWYSDYTNGWVSQKLNNHIPMISHVRNAIAGAEFRGRAYHSKSQHHSTVQTVQQTVREWDVLFFLRKRGWLCAFRVWFCPARSQPRKLWRHHAFIYSSASDLGNKVNTLLQTHRPSFPAAHTSSQSPGKITDRLYGAYTFLGHGCQHILVHKTHADTHRHKVVDWVSRKQKRGKKIQLNWYTLIPASPNSWVSTTKPIRVWWLRPDRRAGSHTHIQTLTHTHAGSSLRQRV